MKRRAVLGGTLLLAALVTSTGCSAPDDEAWLRITGIGEVAENEFTAEGVLPSDLRSGSADLVDVQVQNATIVLGGSGGGVSVTVYNATVEYFVTGHSLRSYNYPVTLFLPAPVSGEAGTAASTAVLSDLPLVPLSLKEWILDPAVFPADLAGSGFPAEARITLRARSEEGRELKTSASVTVIFD